MAKNAPRQMHFYDDFSGGLNTQAYQNLIGENELAEVRNALIGKGFLQKRNGYGKYNTEQLAGRIKDPSKPVSLTKFANSSDVNPGYTGDVYIQIDYMDALGNRTTTGLSQAKISVTSKDSVVATFTVPKEVAKVGFYFGRATNPSRVGVIDMVTTSTRKVTYDVPLGPSTPWIGAYPIIANISGRNVSVTTFATPAQNGAAAATENTMPLGTASSVTGLFNVYRSTGAVSKIVTANGTMFTEIEPGKFTQVGGVDVGATADFIAYKDRAIKDVLLVADGGKLKTYDFATIQEVAPWTPPAPVNGVVDANDKGLNDLSLLRFRAIEIKKDRIFAAANDGVKNRVNFCHRDVNLGYAAFDYWPAPFFFDVAADENDEIVALKVFRDYIIIFCTRSVWALAGDGTTLADYQLTRINVPTGCVAANSVQAVGNELFYLAEDGVYALFATSQNQVSAKLVSQNITPEIKEIPSSSKRQMASVLHDHKYILSCSICGVCYVYDEVLKSWSIWTGLKANAMLSYDGELYFGDTNGWVYKFEEGRYNDDGQPIDFYFRTKNNDFGVPVYKKQTISVMVKARQFEDEASTIDLYMIYDGASHKVSTLFTDSSLVWDEGNFDEAFWDFNPVSTSKKYVSKQGREIQYAVQNNYLDQPCVVYQIDTEYMTLRI